MQHRYHIFFSALNTKNCRDIEKLEKQFTALNVHPHTKGTWTVSYEEGRQFFTAARKLGIQCSFTVTTEYEVADILAAPFGLYQGGSYREDRFRAVLPKDAFDFSDACPSCGLGAKQVKPHLLSQQSLHCKPRCYGADDSPSVILPTPVAHEVIEATGQPECMRHPMTRAGEIIKEWMEPVPLATMPSLSRDLCEGISFGSTDSGSRIGEPPKNVPPCAECGREIWDFDRTQHSRIVYARDQAKALQSLAVVAMEEPWSGFPIYDRKKRMFKNITCCLPKFLYNHDALEVLVNHAGADYMENALLITPVHVE